MNYYLLLIGIVLILCIITQKLTSKLPVPSLLMFLLLGMLFGVDGILKIPFDNYSMSELICSVCLIFIMFYGGFGTSFKEAKPVVLQSGLLATIGVLLTAFLTGAFVHFVLHMPWLQSLLIGSVIASTDAASVFSILKTSNLNLKDNTASMLEVESGSNDPMSYMLTIILCTLLSGQNISIFTLLLNQVLFGILFGVLFGKVSTKVLTRGIINNETKTIFVVGMVVFAYALSSLLGGNGYLSVYLCGIIMGNSKLPKKHELVHFFDTLTGMAQMMIFFLLGLLVTPSQLPDVFIPALLIMLFITFIGRPIAVALTLLPFKASKNQIGLVSFAGLRGVASIVFSIMAVLSDAPFDYNLFNMIFCIVLLSISLQGSLLPYVSKKLNMIDETSDVRKTFNDYRKESDLQFIKIHVDKNHNWNQKSLLEIPLPPTLLVVLIIRNNQNIVPNGSTIIEENDFLVIAAQEFTDKENLSIREIVVEKDHSWANDALKNIRMETGELILMIQRDEQTIIPDGNTLILPNDTLVVVRH